MIKTTPYTYLIKCISTSQFYYGVRFANGCNPNDLWATYFTSSLYVKKLIKKFGKESFITEIRKTFTNKNDAIRWETKILKRLHVVNRQDFINRSDVNIYNFSSRNWINNGIDTKFIDTFFLDDYLTTGWVKGRLFNNLHRIKLSIKAIQRMNNDPNNNPMYGKKRPDLTLRNQMKLNIRKGIPIKVSGIQYSSKKEAMQILNLSWFKLTQITGKSRQA